MIIARTVKGYPISVILADMINHGKPLTAAETEQALALLA